MLRLSGFICATLLALATTLTHAAGPARKTVAILLFDGVEIIDYSGPYEVFYAAGYDVFTVAANKAPLRTAAGEGMLVTPKYSFEDAPRADLVLIPGGSIGGVARHQATLDWIKRAHASANHVLTVCNGSFILANTGLLDGLKATTTAGNIKSLARDYPSITVVSDQRVVDNGKIVTSGGLSAGIDGALHMLDRMSGNGAGATAALSLEYDWRPNEPYLRAQMADRYVPPLADAPFGTPLDVKRTGGKDSWQVDALMADPRTAAGALDALAAWLDKAYRAEGLWQPGSFAVVAKTAQQVEFRFKDREGKSWTGSLSVQTAEPGQLRARYMIARAA